MLFQNFVFYNTVRPMEVIDEAIGKVRPELINSTWIYNGILDVHRPSQMGNQNYSDTIDPHMIHSLFSSHKLPGPDNYMVSSARRRNL